MLTLWVGVLASLAGLAQVIQAAQRQRLHTCKRMVGRSWQHALSTSTTFMEHGMQ
jgi:hypothetical protein